MMKRNTVSLLFAVLFLFILGGCQMSKPLWEVLEGAQYSRYRPRLDHMVKKYGNIFEMDVYGTVTCTDLEYKGWRIRLGGDSDGSITDNFSVRLRRDDIELFIQTIAEPIFGECKIYVCDGFPSKLDADSDAEAFFTYEQPLVYCWIYTPYSENYQAQGEMFMAALLECNYKLWMFDVLYYDEEQYEQADRDWINLGVGPKDYIVRLDARFRDSTGKYSSKWRWTKE